IRLYCRGKDNRVNILKSIDEGPYKLGTFRETLAESTEGTPQLGLPKDIYILINYYTDAKDIWDNVKMLLDGSELTKEDRESHNCMRILNTSNNIRKSQFMITTSGGPRKGKKMILERLSQPTTDPLALLSNVSNTQHGSPSSSTSSITPLPPPRANSSSPADDLIENLTSTLALLTQSYRTFLPQT
nr:integrase, catalytic region, zinc finger, CCHC-type, peptidase aspartic, catalytic [Tanacetum cinerariifolium]